MKRRTSEIMFIMLVCLGVFFALIFSYKAYSGFRLNQFYAAKRNQPITVSATKAAYQEWQPTLNSTGSLRAIRGVNVTSELGGTVQIIHFTPGAEVKQGDLLVTLNIDADVALLQALQASAEIAAINYKRDRAQYGIKAVSRAQLDADISTLKNAQALVDQQAATVAKKVIHAPFSGKLGVSQVNPGQFLNPGDPIVTLQALDPIWIDFFLPQQNLRQVALGQKVTLIADTYPDRGFTGKITTINPIVDQNTRNFQIEATIENPKHELLPGMFGTVTIDTGKPVHYLTLPQSAIVFNPYGDLVFIVNSVGKDKRGNPVLTVEQRFVTVGDRRGNQIAILNGLKEGDEVVSSGQIKLRNGSNIVINNTVVPSDDPAPIVPNIPK